MIQHITEKHRFSAANVIDLLTIFAFDNCSVRTDNIPYISKVTSYIKISYPYDAASAAFGNFRSLSASAWYNKACRLSHSRMIKGSHTVYLHSETLYVYFRELLLHHFGYTVRVICIKR